MNSGVLTANVPVGTGARVTTHAVPPRVLVIAEQGLTFKQGLVEIFQAPFVGPPKRLYNHSPKGVAIAPNGDLVVFDEYDGLWVYDPPFTGRPRRISTEEYPTGQLLFDSEGQLFAVDGSEVYVFDPPYNSRPEFTISVGPELGEVAFDSHYNLFASASGNTIYECIARKHYKCRVIPKMNGGVALNGKNDLFTSPKASRSGTLAELPRPYDKVIAKTNVGFGPGALAVASGGLILASGYDSSETIHLAVLPSSMTGSAQQLPIEQYFTPLLAFVALKNRGDLFVSAESHQGPCVDIYHYPYNKRSIRCVKAKYSITAVTAQ